jgi:hypothetical protein
MDRWPGFIKARVRLLRDATPSSPEEAMRGFLSGDDPGLAACAESCGTCPTDRTASFVPRHCEGPGGAILRHVWIRPFLRQPVHL